MSCVAGCRVCSLAVALVLALGSASMSVSSSVRCQCPPNCPMHVHGLTCHHRPGLGCHQSRPGAGIHRGCDRGAEQAVPVLSIRGILPVSHPARPPEAHWFFKVASMLMATQPFPEPPTHSPRVGLV